MFSACTSFENSNCSLFDFTFLLKDSPIYLLSYLKSSSILLSSRSPLTSLNLVRSILNMFGLPLNIPSLDLQSFQSSLSESPPFLATNHTSSCACRSFKCRSIGVQFVNTCRASVLVELRHPDAFNMAVLCTFPNSLTHSS